MHFQDYIRALVVYTFHAQGGSVMIDIFGQMCTHSAPFYALYIEVLIHEMLKALPYNIVIYSKPPPPDS